MTVFCFSFYLFTCLSPGGRKGTPPIIGRTCVFDAKIYKNVDAIINVSPCAVWNKKICQISDFSFQLPALLVEKRANILPILTRKDMKINR